MANASFIVRSPRRAHAGFERPSVSKGGLVGVIGKVKEAWSLMEQRVMERLARADLPVIGHRRSVANIDRRSPLQPPEA